MAKKQAKRVKKVSGSLPDITRTDAEIGAAIRKLLSEAQEKWRDSEVDACDVCARILAGIGHKMGADEAKISIGGFTVHGEPVGDWSVTIKREAQP
jgi:hypothetical protein